MDSESDMATVLQVYGCDGYPYSLPVDRYPEYCSRCGYAATNILILGAQEVPPDVYDTTVVYAICRCPRPACERSFVAVYSVINRSHGPQGTLLSSHPIFYVKPPRFSSTIATLSPCFVETYEQASCAEENGLAQICGPGYRKALEYLVKDFLIAVQLRDQPEKASAIPKLLLGRCIQNYIEHGPLKEAALRAAWLGNDETHYYRIWANQDLEDLKALIYLTVHWMDLTVRLGSFQEDMPDKR